MPGEPNPNILNQASVVAREWRELFSDAGKILPTFIVDAGGLGDFRTIQEAVDALFDDGGTILVKPGTYALTQTITLPDKPVRIMGMLPTANSHFDAKDTVRVDLGAYVIAAFTVPASIDATTNHVYVIENIKFYGTGLAGQHVIKNLNLTDYNLRVFLSGCYFNDIEMLVRNYAGAAYFYFDGCSGSFPNLATSRHYWGNTNNYSALDWVDSRMAYDASYNARGGVTGNDYLSVYIRGSGSLFGFGASATIDYIEVMDQAYLALGDAITLSTGALNGNASAIIVAYGGSSAAIAVDGAAWYGSTLVGIEASGIDVTVAAGTVYFRSSACTFKTLAIAAGCPRVINGVGGPHLSETSVNGYVTVVDQASPGGLIGGIGIKNTGGANTLTQQLTLVDFYGTTYTATPDLAPAGTNWVDLNVQYGSCRLPYKSAKLEVKSKVAGSHSTYQVYSALGGAS